MSINLQELIIKSQPIAPKNTKKDIICETFDELITTPNGIMIAKPKYK